MRFSNLARSIVPLFLLAGALCAHATVHETVTFTNVDSDGEYGDAVNQVRTFAATGLTAGNVPYALGKIDFAGTITAVETFDYALEGLVEVKHPNGMISVMQMFPDDFTFGTLTGGASVVVGANTNAAGNWEFRFFEDFDDGGNGAVDKTWNSLQVNFTDELPSPPSSQNEGAICDPGLSLTTEIGESEVKWFRIEIPESTGGNDRYFDIDTEGSDPLDTEIGLYSEFGSLIANDDDDGDGLRSQVSFGPDAGIRSGTGDGEDYDGRDGELSASTYYVAVGLYDTEFSSSFDVTSDSTDAGTVTLNFTTNMTCALIEGNVVLASLDGDSAGCEVTFEIRAVGSTSPIEVHTATLDAAGNYSFSTSVPAGTYDISAKGTHWLRQVEGSVTVSSSGAVDVDFSLINGDADPDNEVNIVDAGTLATAFGSDPESANWNPNADLDKDGEVTLVDNGILAANFGLNGDD